MRVEDFFERGIAGSLKHSGVENLVQLETPVSELLRRFEERGYRILDPMQLSNEQRPFIHDGIGRYKVWRDSEDPDVLDPEILTVVTRADDQGGESLPFVFDKDMGLLGRFIFE